MKIDIRLLRFVMIALLSFGAAWIAMGSPLTDCLNFWTEVRDECLRRAGQDNAAQHDCWDQYNEMIHRCHEEHPYL